MEGALTLTELDKWSNSTFLSSQQPEVRAAGIHIITALDTTAVHSVTPVHLHVTLVYVCVGVCKFKPILQNLTPAVWSSRDS